MAKQNPQLNGAVRSVTGKKVKTLRKQGLIPATVYGQEMTPASVQFPEKELNQIFDHVGESGLVDLMLGGKKLPILFRNPQYHPVDGNLIHLDCYKVNLKEKITTTVPLTFINESPSVKGGNVLVEVLNEVEVEALPTDLPESIEVDLSKLETLESMITVAELNVDRSKVEITNDPEQVVVKTEEPRVEEEPAPAEEVAPGDVPATAQKTEEEKQEGEEKKEE